MTEGVDYSYSHPSPSGLKAAGKRFAVRYVGVTTSGKSLTRTEVLSLRAAGIDVVAVYQTTANFMFMADGAVAARRAHQHAVACGMPSTRPIYFALDTNPASMTGAQWSGVERFLNAAASVLGRNRVGVYAGYGGIERLVPRFAAWGWQTYAWSAGRWSPRAQLQQYRNGVSLAGGTVDLCRSIVTDYGQWGVVAPIEEEDVTPAEVNKVLVDAISTPGHPFREQFAKLVDSRLAIYKVAREGAVADVDEAAIASAVAAAVIEALPDEVTDEVTAEEVKAAVVAGLGSVSVRFVPETEE